MKQRDYAEFTWSNYVCSTISSLNSGSEHERRVYRGDILFYLDHSTKILQDFANIASTMPSERIKHPSAKRFLNLINKKNKTSFTLDSEYFIGYLNFICEPIIVIDIVEDVRPESGRAGVYILCYRVKHGDGDEVYRGVWDTDHTLTRVLWNGGEGFCPLRGLLENS